MNVNKTNSLYLFENLCSGIPLWLEEDIGGIPNFTDCFVTTITEWVPCVWLFVASPLYVAELQRRATSLPLPYTTRFVIKVVISLLIIAITCLLMWNVGTHGLHCDQTSVSPSFYVGYSLRCLCLILVCIFQHYLRRKGVVSSVVIFTYWSLLFLCGAIPLLSFRSIGCLHGAIYVLYLALVGIQLILHCFADKRSPQAINMLNNDGKVCPLTEVSCVNHSIFAWFSKTIFKAYKKTLTQDDLWQQTASLQNKNVVEEILKGWNYRSSKFRNKGNIVSNSIQLNKAHEETPLLHGNDWNQNNNDELRKPDNGPSLFWTLFMTYYTTWLKSCIFKMANQVCLLVQTLILREIILTTDSKDDGDRQWGTILLCLVLVMLHILGSVAYNQAVYTTTTLGLRIKSGLIGLIYRKCLRVSNSFKKNYTIGEIVTMASVDCQRIMDRMMYSYQIICFPFVISLGIFELWVYTGISTLGAIGVMIMVCVLSTIFGKILEKCLQALLHSKGSRIKLITEILNGFKHMKIPLFDNYFMKMTTHQKVVFPRAVIKMFAWEPTFTKKIEDIRNKELRSLKTTASVNALSILVNNQSPFMISYFVFLIYTLTDESKHLDAGTAFLVTSMVNVLRFEIGLIPWNITGFVQIYVSIKRIRKFLCENEMATDNVQYISSGEYAVQIQHGRFTWDKEDSSVTLDGINARITEGKLVAIVGPVGCGKSSLLSAILGEMEKLQGIVFVKGSVAYVPQEAWIQNLTVRENILHDRRYQKRKYDKVVNACALCSDLAILPAGDKTEIGQKGSNLSGGHKQRISTARAVYNNADIYLFDDPLSAVDSNVGKNIFDDVIGNKGMLKNKTRILVTHGIRWLPYVDEVYLMNNGQIVGRGSYKELLKHNASFAQFLKTYLANEYVFKEEFGEESLCDEYLEHIELLTSDGDNSDFERISLRNGNIMEKRISEQGHSRKVVTMTDQSNDWRTTQDESMEEGKVKLSVLWGYMKGMGIKGLIPCLAFLIFNQSLSVYSNFWLTYWTEDGYLNNMSLTSTVGYSERTNYYIIVYSVLGFLQGLFLYLFGIIAMLCVVRAASQLHSGMLKSVMRSPMAFFDTTPTGRIVNRFSSDVDIMDIRMQDTFRGWSITLMTALSTVTAIGVQTPTFLIALVPLAALFAFVLKIYLPTPRQMKRLESVTRSPIYNQINETIAGASIIRAFKSTDAFIADLQKRTDENTRFYHGALLATRWMGVIVDLFGSVLLLVVSLSAALSPGLNGGEVGLSISYGIQIAYTFYYVVDTISEMEINIIASERLFEYAKLESEADWKSVQKPPKTWPSNGEIEFRNYATRYRPGLDLVLRDINCKIYSGEKIGVVGRTGAGKSSITLSLFRLIEGAAGSIIIDGLATSGLGLHDLRRKITILPQDPVLFSGTVRFNLDPDETLSDSDIWKALDCAHLKTFVSKQQEKLGFPVEEFGQNLSVGQRQLVCLGRALLHKNKILILDEATAAVDMETDELIQETIRQEFADCTVLTVAHRLNTIMDYDRIMVMDKGQIVQFDSPKNLLQKKAGMFYAMAKDADLVNWFNFSNQK